jgi:methylase of polypeptide subunit release factors
VFGDVDRKALAFSAVNAVVNDVATKTVFSDVLAGIEGPADIIVANVPYLADNNRRPGGDFGRSLAVRIVEQSLERLNRGGRLVLYSGTTIIGGTDPLLDALQSVLQRCRQTSATRKSTQMCWRGAR